MKGPLASFEDNIRQFVSMSQQFAVNGDPRSWPALTGEDWTDDDTREWGELAYDEWVSGAWNHIDGVVKPSDVED